MQLGAERVAGPFAAQELGSDAAGRSTVTFSVGAAVNDGVTAKNAKVQACYEKLSAKATHMSINSSEAHACMRG